jgi:hypothetical protein
MERGPSSNVRHQKIKEGNIIEKAFYAGKGSEPDAPSDSK